ncbi:nuclear polyadenylated RNA-binding protein-like protein Nab2 [Bisporella sp. PMI_857]|nr:nuclear polyadenylated RNA-binding protein-like protein Nab2 [Bisporella sp. PMI_857]
MATDTSPDSQLSQALSAAIQPKLAEMGWSTGADDDAALAEYIMLLWSNGKTEAQLGAELSGDLLSLSPDDPGVQLFSRWLFEQADALRAQINGAEQPGADTNMVQDAGKNEDAEMGDASDVAGSNVPTGPKSMRNSGAGRLNSNPRDKRFLGHLTKAMDRTGDAALHRVRPQVGNERINTHRGPPTGPRAQTSIKGAAARANGRGINQAGAHNTAAQNLLNMSPQQTFQLYAMLEQQTQYFANLLSPQQQQALQQQMGNSGMAFPANQTNNNFNQQRQGKSLFDRVQPRPNANKSFTKKHDQGSEDSSAMDVQMSQPKVEASPDTTCRWNLTCTNKDCKFAHQSPAAPPGTAIDPSDICSFGAACKNRKCTGRHPSPAQKLAHQTEQDCMFYPNCTKGESCPYRHPTMPPCRNGADCSVEGCKFFHIKTVCKWNPCLNPACTFKHEDGQKRGKYEDKVWIAKDHISERKFVDENKPEEVIIPGSNPGASIENVGQATRAVANPAQQELIT